jgi:hypothetical protein
MCLCCRPGHGKENLSGHFPSFVHLSETVGAWLRSLNPSVSVDGFYLDDSWHTASAAQSRGAHSCDKSTVRLQYRYLMIDVQRKWSFVYDRCKTKRTIRGNFLILFARFQSRSRNVAAICFAYRSQIGTNAPFKSDSSGLTYPD